VSQHGGTRAGGIAIGSWRDVGIEHRDKRAEVAVPGGGEERVGNLSLAGQAGAGGDGTLCRARIPRMA
jgi:hypothetical protein